MPDSVTDTTDADSYDRPIRVLTFNTFFGCRLDAVVRLLAEVKPDLAFIQELFVHHYRGWTWDQAESLARGLRMNHTFRRLVWRDGAELGVAVLSTGRITDPAALGGPPDRPSGHSCRVRLRGRTISVAAVHFSSVPRPVIIGYPYILSAHRRQAECAVDRLRQMGGPAILAGDMNTIPGMPAHRLVCRHLTDIARLAHDRTGTRRTLGIPLRLDYIFASPHFTCEQYQVLPRAGSDHCPVVATLRWTGTPDGPPATPPNDESGDGA